MHILNWLIFWPVFVRCLGKLSLRHLLYMAKRFANENPHKHDGKHQKGQLDTAGAKEIIKQIDSLGTAIIGFTGGEPLVRDDIVELVGSVGGRMTSVMFTTGHNLDGALASALKKAGMDCLMIGVESDRRDVHDRTRGAKGSFDEAIRSIRISLDAGLYTGISTVATRDKIADGTIEKLARLAQTHGAQEFRILEPVPTGGIQSRIEHILTAEESRRMYDFHIQWNRRHKDMAVASFAYLESDDMFGCGAGYHHLFMDALGNVCPCDLTPLSMGNVCDEELGTIWERMGRWFDKPRCGCFMKQLYEHAGALETDTVLPLETGQASSLCEACRRDDKLPQIYKGLLE